MSRLSRRDAWGTFLTAQVLVELLALERIAALSGKGWDDADEQAADLLDRERKRLVALLRGTQARERAAACWLVTVS
jgi:uracil DNA glycosylase